MLKKIILIFFILFVQYDLTLAQQVASSSPPKDLLYYYNAELEKLEKEIAVLGEEFLKTPNPVLLAALNEKKVKREVLNIYGSKVVKRSFINLNTFAYFSASKAFLDKQKELEEKYDIIINLSADQQTLEEVKGLGKMVLKTFSKNENSAKNRRIDVSFHANSGSSDVVFNLNLSPPLQEELSSKPEFQGTYSLENATSATNLVTKLFFNDFEQYLSVLVLRFDEKNISELWELRNKPDSTITFMSPAGKPFTLYLKRLSELSFSYNDEDLETAKKFDFFADGALQSFTYDKVQYTRCRTENHKERFEGFYTKTSSSSCNAKKIDSLSKNCPQKTQVVVVYACVVNGSLVFKANKVALSPGVNWPNGNHDGSGNYLPALPVQFNTASGDPIILSAAALTNSYSIEAKTFLEKLNICDRDYIPYAITVANIITRCPKVVSECYGLQRLIDDFDLTKHLLSAGNTSIPQIRSPLEQYQDKVVQLIQRADELQHYATSSQNTDNLSTLLDTYIKVREFVNDPSNICALNFLSPGERIRLLKILITNSDWATQKAIVLLFKTLNIQISDTKTIEFLSALTGPSSSVSGAKSIITKVYDIVTLNDYTDLNKTLCEKFTAKAGVINHYFPDTEGKVFENILYYDDSYRTGGAPIGTHRYDIELLDNGNVKIKSEYVSEYISYTVKLENRYTPRWVADYTTTVSPFTVITFVNRSGLSSIDEVSKEDDIIAAPAIFLKFVQDKKFNYDALQVASLVADALIVTTGPGAIVKAYRAGRMAVALFEGMQVVGSLAHIPTTTLGPDDPLRKWVDDFNLIVVAWGGAKILTNPKIYNIEYYRHVQTHLFTRMDKVSIQHLINRYELLKGNLNTYLQNTNVSKEIDKVIDYLKGMVKSSTLASNVKFTTQQIDGYANLATRQFDRAKVMLGKFDSGGPTGYVSRAGNDHCYFDMGDKWDEAFNLVNKNSDEMWRINQKFIDNQRTVGKEFFLSHDPQFATGYYLREVNYLTNPISQGGLGGSVVNQGNNLWKVIW